MIVSTPTARQLVAAPEFAILAALEVALVAASEAIAARYPALLDDDLDYLDCAPGIEMAFAFNAQARQLLETINRYRLSIAYPDEPDF